MSPRNPLSYAGRVALANEFLEKEALFFVRIHSVSSSQIVTPLACLPQSIEPTLEIVIVLAIVVFVSGNE